MKIGLLAIAIIAIGGIALFGSAITGRNKLITEKEAINSQWSQVDVVLQRRADLIPNLVNTVKGYAKQEQAVIKEVTDARASLLGARGSRQDEINANGRLDSALGRLLVLTENYPNLKSNENFLRLQDELSGTENRIAVERRKYNDTVKQYNTDIQLFPNNMTAALFGLKYDDAYFKTDPGARTVPSVNF